MRGALRTLAAGIAGAPPLQRAFVAPPPRRRPPPRGAAALADDDLAAASAEVCALRVSISDVPGAIAEDLAELLLAEGAESSSVEQFRPPGAPEEEIFKHATAVGAPAAPRVWARCTVLAHFSPAAAGAAAAAAAAAAALGVAGAAVTAEKVRTRDWEAAVRAAYVPVEIAPRLWVTPSWAPRPPPRDAGAAAEHDTPDTVIVLEPGLAFGTGDHPTTRLCLRWLQRTLAARGSNAPATAAAPTPARIMDYGCGSGVLAAAALVMASASTAVGVDVEPLAVRAAAHSAALNGVADRLVALGCSPDAAPEAEPLAVAGLPAAEIDAAFDVVVANILAGPLIALAPRLALYARDGAALGLSGVTAAQAAGVAAAYAPWFERLEVEVDAGGAWALVSGVRRAR
jgi:ribosomal protein L11 methyltransferase